MEYRSRTEIIAHMLDAASGGVTKTRIMYRAYLSYAQLKEYLVVLIENGLIEYEAGEQKYRTTGKGTRFLSVYHNMDQLAGPMHKRSIVV